MSSWLQGLLGASSMAATTALYKIALIILYWSDQSRFCTFFSSMMISATAQLGSSSILPSFLLACPWLIDFVGCRASFYFVRRGSHPFCWPIACCFAVLVFSCSWLMARATFSFLRPSVPVRSSSFSPAACPCPYLTTFAPSRIPTHSRLHLRSPSIVPSCCY